VLVGVTKHIQIIVVVLLCAAIVPVSLMLNTQLVPSDEWIKANCTEPVSKPSNQPHENGGAPGDRIPISHVLNAEPASPKGNAAEGHVHQECRVAEYTKALALITVWLFGATALLGIGTFLAAAAALAAARHIPTIEKAYVFGGPVVAASHINAHRVRLTLGIENLGKTPAWNAYD
jgi:hypothetical protein